MLSWLALKCHLSIGRVGSIVTEFFRQLLFLFCFVLLLNWCTQTVTTLIFFTNFISWFAMFLSTLLRFTLFLIVLISVLSSSLLFSIDSVISVIDLNESSTSGMTKSMFSLHFFSTKIGFYYQQRYCESGVVNSLIMIQL